MTHADYVLAAYVLTGLVVLGLVIFTWRDWRRVRADYARLFVRKGGDDA